MLLLVGNFACGTPAGPCPPGTFADGDRASALSATVRGTLAGRGLAIDSTMICFGGGARGTVRSEGLMVLAASLESDAAAARLTHIGMHVADRLHAFPMAGVPCERQVEIALTAEARAIVAEIEVCDELKCDAAPYTFTAAVLAVTSSERAAQVLARLQSEPKTDGLDMLVRGYRARCEDGGE